MQDEIEREIQMQEAHPEPEPESQKRYVTTPEDEARLEKEKKLMQESLSHYFEPAEEVTAQHILFKQFVATWGPMLNKFQVYLSWLTAWGMPTEKDPNGNLGYKMKVIPPPASQA